MLIAAPQLLPKLPSWVLVASKLKVAVWGPNGDSGTSEKVKETEPVAETVVEIPAEVVTDHCWTFALVSSNWANVT